MVNGLHTPVIRSGPEMGNGAAQAQTRIAQRRDAPRPAGGIGHRSHHVNAARRGTQADIVTQAAGLVHVGRRRPAQPHGIRAGSGT